MHEVSVSSLLELNSSELKIVILPLLRLESFTSRHGFVLKLQFPRPDRIINVSAGQSLKFPMDRLEKQRQVPGRRGHHQILLEVFGERLVPVISRVGEPIKRSE